MVRITSKGPGDVLVDQVTIVKKPFSQMTYEEKVEALARMKGARSVSESASRNDGPRSAARTPAVKKPPKPKLKWDPSLA